MCLVSRLISFWRHAIDRQKSDIDLDDEIQSQLQMLVDERVKQGMVLAEAERAARIELGGVEQVKEQVRSVRTGVWIDSFVQDISFAFRMLRKNIGFTALAVLTLTLGIGANTAIFSLIDAWVIKPLPFPHPDRLMVFLSHDTKAGWTSSSNISNGDFVDLENLSKSFESMTAWTATDFDVTGNGPPTFTEGGLVSWNFFDVLGVSPLLGRTFSLADDSPGAHHVAMISEGLWRSRFANDPRVIGRSITISDETYTIIGVVSGKFQFPLMGIANLWTPLAFSEEQRMDRTAHTLAVFGRLKNGVTVSQAAGETSSIFAGLEAQFPATNKDLTALLSPMSIEVEHEEGIMQAATCLCITILILLVACVNVSNLIVGKFTHRSRELTIRGALGATRVRLVRQLLIETVLLFSLGGLGGTFVGFCGMQWIQSEFPAHMRGYLVNFGHISLDLTTFGFAQAIALLCGLCFGIAPAFRSSAIDLNGVLKEASARRTNTRVKRVFVSLEVALTVLVLVIATLLIKSFLISVNSSPGFNPNQLMTVQLQLPRAQYSTNASTNNFADDLLLRVRALPGVSSAAVASGIPFGGFGRSVEFELWGRPKRFGSRLTAISTDYLRTMQMSLRAGRDFSSTDDQRAPKVVLINATFAKQFWPNESPIGKTFSFGPEHATWTIIGVVNNVKMYSLRERPARQMYVPLAQFPSATMGVVVRSRDEEKPLANAIRNSVWAVDSNQPLSSIEQMETLIGVEGAANRILAHLMLSFGLLATFLGAIGVFGVMAEIVTQRTPEIGIRIALGATRTSVMHSVLADGFRLSGIGIVAGILVAFPCAQMLASMFYEVKPYDPLTFATVTMFFGFVTLLACYIPARQAMLLDPMVALRRD